MHIVGHNFHSCGRSLKDISFKKFSFGQKRPCALRYFVPRGVFGKTGGGGSLSGNNNNNNNRGYLEFRACELRVHTIFNIYIYILTCEGIRSCC